MIENPSGLFAFQIAVFVVMLVGLASLATFLLPSLVIIWVGALIYGIVMGFNGVLSAVLFALITILMLVGSFVDNVLMGAAARQQGASWWAVTIALIGGIVGSLVWPPFGGLLFAFLGLFIFEWIRRRNINHAWQATFSMAKGCGWSFFIRFGMGVAMILLWGLWVLYG